MQHVVPVLHLLILLTLANGAPVIARKVLGDVLAHPVDGGRSLRDGQPIFGRSKTFRGLVAAVLLTTAGAAAIGLDAATGALVAAAAMAGDLLSSFIKRRQRLAPSSRSIGLDQIPESLLPAVLAAPQLGLGLVDVLVVVAAFLVGELLLSRLLFRLGLRDRPY
ncbi:MAG: CDP-archaeol synthase [Hyphomicrobiales bacterium]|nr:CDP-archaeol synthase [Hyphomicrobiales bacterium]